MTDIVRREPDSVTRSAYSSEQMQLIKDQVCKDASDDELQMFMAIAKRTELDPFTGQIWFVKRWDAQSRRMIGRAQIGIDGFRTAAQRTGEYRGQTPPQWCGKDGKWVDVWLGDGVPAAARAGVFRAGFVEPCYAVARYDSYCQRTKQGEPTKMWSASGFADVMLHKCAESLALRKAFPERLSGVYTTDEMQQAGNPAPGQAQDSRVGKSITANYLERIRCAKDDQELRSIWLDARRVLGKGEQLESITTESQKRHDALYPAHDEPEIITPDTQTTTGGISYDYTANEYPEDFGAKKETDVS